MTAARSANPRRGASAQGQRVEKPPPGFVELAEAVRVLGVSDETLRRHYQGHGGRQRIPMWRDPLTAKVHVDISNLPPELAELSRRRHEQSAQKPDAGIVAAEEHGSLAALRHHLLWLEGFLREERARAEAQAAHAAEERAQAHEERQRLLAVIERLTGRE